MQRILRTHFDARRALETEELVFGTFLSHLPQKPSFDSGCFAGSHQPSWFLSTFQTLRESSLPLLTSFISTTATATRRDTTSLPSFDASMLKRKQLVVIQLDLLGLRQLEWMSRPTRPHSSRQRKFANSITPQSELSSAHGKHRKKKQAGSRAPKFAETRSNMSVSNSGNKQDKMTSPDGFLSGCCRRVSFVVVSGLDAALRAAGKGNANIYSESVVEIGFRCVMRRR